MKYIKENIIFFITIILISIIGSIFASIYTINSLDTNILNDILKQGISKELIIVITSIQYTVYSIICTYFGIILANKTGLWKNITFEKSKTIKTKVISTILGLLLFSDIFIFSNYNEIIKQSYNIKPSLISYLASITYGGVIEEIMLRLFFMSLLVYIITKLFHKKTYILANIISSLTFALLHLPATQLMFGELNTLLIIRCLVLNVPFGLTFGTLYHKYGIQYAILSHISVHLVFKTIWLLFI